MKFFCFSAEYLYLTVEIVVVRYNLSTTVAWLCPKFWNKPINSSKANVV